MSGNISLMLAALFYGAISLSAMLRPQNLLKSFGIVVTNADGRNEIHAVYGGFPLALAGLLLFSMGRHESSDGILLALAISSAGMAIGRVISAVIDRSMGKSPALFTALEFIVAAMIASGISRL